MPQFETNQLVYVADGIEYDKGTVVDEDDGDVVIISEVHNKVKAYDSSDVYEKISDAYRVIGENDEKRKSK